MGSRKTGGHEPDCGGFTCRDLIVCVQWSIWMFGVALWLALITPSPSQAHGNSDLVLVDPGAAACGPIAVLASARDSLAITCRINRSLIVARSGGASSAAIESATSIGVQANGRVHRRWRARSILVPTRICRVPCRDFRSAALAYVVSPPPATREVMPRYLPRLPPEDAARIPQVATRSARRLRVGCRCGHLRPRHARRCTHCRHRAEHLGAPRRCRHAGHCATHRHGRSEQRRWRRPHLHRKAVNGIDGQGGDRVAIAAAFGVVVASARLEDGRARWVSVNDYRSPWARFEAAYNPGCKVSRYGSKRCSKKVDIPINAWPLRAFPAAI
jgi:hypothetical protein